MKFKCNTKPLADALALGVVDGNISKFYAKSCMAQITATRNALFVNLEASYVLSEIQLNGMGDEDGPVTVMVDNKILKQLVSTLDTTTITLEFAEGGLIVESGKSTFTLPQMLDEADMTLDKPVQTDPMSVASIDVDKSSWKFIKDCQMYAIAMSYARPIYTRVWLGDDGDVIVGDIDNSIFTHSKKNNLGTTCLLSDTIINLLNALPEGAKLIKVDKSYVVKVNTDGFSFTSQFTPQYEDDESLGTYNSEIILNMLTVPSNPDEYAVVSTLAINKFLSQASLFADGADSIINLSVEGQILRLYSEDVNGSIPMKGTCEEFELAFKLAMLKDVITHYDEENICIAPMKNEEGVVGVLVWTDELTTVLAGVE